VPRAAAGDPGPGECGVPGRSLPALRPHPTVGCWGCVIHASKNPVSGLVAGQGSRVCQGLRPRESTRSRPQDQLWTCMGRKQLLSTPLLAGMSSHFLRARSMNGSPWRARETALVRAGFCGTHGARACAAAICRAGLQRCGEANPPHDCLVMLKRGSATSCCSSSCSPCNQRCPHGSGGLPHAACAERPPYHLPNVQSLMSTSLPPPLRLWRPRWEPQTSPLTA